MCFQESTATVSEIEMCILRSLKYLFKKIFCLGFTSGHKRRRHEKLKYLLLIFVFVLDLYVFISFYIIKNDL